MVNTTAHDPLIAYLDAQRPLPPMSAIALRIAVDKLLQSGALSEDPIIQKVAAISCGIYEGTPVLDLDYPEDSEAGVDGNFIMLGSKQLIEVQMSAEGSVFSRDQMNALMDLAEKGVEELAAAQKAAVAGAGNSRATSWSSRPTTRAS